MRGLRAYFLISFVASLLALLICEPLVRLVGYVGEELRIPLPFDDNYVAVAPNSWIFQLAVSNSEFKINGADVPLQKPVGEKRLLFIGDSGTVGAGVPISSSFAMLSAEVLSRVQPNGTFRSINAGVAGFTLLNDYRIFEKLERLKPEVVVLGVFMANDINTILQHSREPMAHVKGAVLEPHPRPWWYRSALLHFFSLQLINAQTALLERGLMPDLNQGTLPASIWTIDEFGINVLSLSEGELALYRQHESALVSLAYRNSRFVLEQFVELARRRGSKPVLVLIPSTSTLLGEFYMPKWPETLNELVAHGRISPDEKLDFDKPTRFVLEFCRQQEIICLDLVPVLREQGKEAFLPHDDHLSLSAHAAAAKAIARIIMLQENVFSASDP